MIGMIVTNLCLALCNLMETSWVPFRPGSNHGTHLECTTVQNLGYPPWAGLLDLSAAEHPEKSILLIIKSPALSTQPHEGILTCQVGVWGIRSRGFGFLQVRNMLELDKWLKKSRYNYKYNIVYSCNIL